MTGGRRSGRLGTEVGLDPGAEGGVEVRAQAFTSHDVVRLLIGADAFNEALYGHADASPLRPEEFAPAMAGVFLIVYRNGLPVACGGLRRAHPPAPQDAGEIKRMFVVEAARRQGMGRLLLAALEDAARLYGYPQVILDTGHKQQAAHALYEDCGYHPIPGFTIYRDVPGNRAYAKDIPSGRSGTPTNPEPGQRGAPGGHRVQLVDDDPGIVAEATRSGWDAVLTRRTGDVPVEEYTPQGPIR